MRTLESFGKRNKQIIKSLESGDDVWDYLNAALENGDLRVLAMALMNVYQSEGYRRISDSHKVHLEKRTESRLRRLKQQNEMVT